MLRMFPITKFICDPTPINWFSVAFRRRSVSNELTSIHVEEHSQLVFQVSCE